MKAEQMNSRRLPGITYCETSDRLVFLDPGADRYFCLTASAEERFRESALHGNAQYQTAILHDAGVSGTAQMERAPVRCPQIPVATESLLDSSGQSVQLVVLARALFRLFLVGRGLKRGRLGELLRAIDKNKIRRQSPKRLARPHCALQALASNFEWTARFSRSHDACLARSITLTKLALAQGLQVDLVIGVRLHPFAAHSWVQAGHVLINDRADNVRTYTPILVL